MVKEEKEKIKIWLNSNAVVNAVFDKEVFRSSLVKGFNFKKGIYKSLRVNNHTTNFKQTDLKEFLRLGVDWTQLFFDHMHTSSEVVNIDVFKLDVMNFGQFVPDVIYGEGCMTYSVNKVKLSTFLFVHHVDGEVLNEEDGNRFVERALSHKLIDFAEKKWMKKVNL